MNKIRINTHGNEMPVSHGEWIDLRTAEDVELDPLEFKIISLGVAMELPEGYYARLCRSWKSQPRRVGQHWIEIRHYHSAPCGLKNER